ncbi:FMN reductase [Sanguibacter gelidistatuariae]|uniref:FMN reductase n=1 Tax=Sanguibacter gelidistatuariae TaxID=1814289 RepID=A0A1G6HGV6_9MICO|nr:NAD(P)H-dependent oxidoreductase [Sanguibacter gelidistatuariae]SDB93441.1 FMN reductase [Sanguibacter gelidistatuariae]
MSHTHLAPDAGTRPDLSVVVVSGNPRAGSRTLSAATAVGEQIAALLDGRLDGPSSTQATSIETIDLATFAPEILTADHPAADAATATLAAATVAVIASPVYKASYTGLLKAFLDLYGPDGLAGVVAVPLVVSGNPAHALAGEVHLRPVLVELGAIVPTRALSLTESQLADLDAPVAAWLAKSARALRRAVGLPDDAGTAPLPASADLVGVTA